MAGNRGHGQPWEIHLGSLQIVIWSGLAVGAVIGSYFLGFLSGRFVGFETARSASGIEVAKLTLTDELPEQASPSVSAIYDKLNAPLSLNDLPSAKVVNNAQQPTAPPPGVQAAQAIKEGERQRLHDEMAKAGTDRDVAATADKAARVATEAREGAVAAAEIDSLFNGQDASATDDIDAFRVVDAPEKSVRLLGGAASTASASSDKTLGAMLDERLAKARRENEKGVIVAEGNKAPRLEIEKQDNAPTKSVSVKTTVEREDSAAKGVAKSASVTPGKTATAPDVEKTSTPPAPVRQVLPTGYFAQVAAPKRIADAQDVARKLKKSGFPVVIEEADVRGESFFRVLVGPEENKVQADRLVGQLQRERYLSGTPFVKRVK